MVLFVSNLPETELSFNKNEIYYLHNNNKEIRKVMDDSSNGNKLLVTVRTCSFIVALLCMLTSSLETWP